MFFACKDNEFSLCNNENMKKKFNHHQQNGKSPAKQCVLPGLNCDFSAFRPRYFLKNDATQRMTTAPTMAVPS